MDSKPKKHEEEQPRKATRFQWAGLLLTNFGPIKALLIIIFGLGTATNEHVQKQVFGIFGANDFIELPEGSTADIDPESQGAVFRANLRQSIAAINAKLKTHDRSINTLSQDYSLGDYATRDELERLSLKVDNWHQ